MAVQTRRKGGPSDADPVYDHQRRRMRFMRSVLPYSLVRLLLLIHWDAGGARGTRGKRC
jgi:hypothetical protein